MEYLASDVVVGHASPRRRRSALARRFLTLFALASVTAFAAACSGGSDSPESPTAAATGTPSASVASATPLPVVQAETEWLPDVDPELDRQPATRWEAIEAGIGDDGVASLEMALQEFSVLIAPLPGVDLPALPAGDDADESATLAIATIQLHWSELSEAQQDAVLAVFAEGFGTAGAASSMDVADEGRSRPILFQGAPTSTNCFSEPDIFENGPGVEPYVDALNAIQDDVANRLGKLTIPVYVARFGVAYGAAHAFTIAQTPDCMGAAKSCNIYITPLGETESGRTLEMIVAHELVHCYQAEIRVDVLGGGPRWIVEGFAAWAGQDIVGGVPFAKTDKWWFEYLTQPGKPLFTRSYDAIGFWANAQAHGSDLYDLFPAFTQNDNKNAFFFSVGRDQDPQQLLDAWAAGIARDPSRGGIWDATGVEITGDRYEVPVHEINNGQGIDLLTSAVSTDLDLVNLDSDFATFEFSEGAFGRIGLENGSDRTFAEVMNEAVWCTGTECTCPAGTEHEGESFVEWQGRSALVAVTGAERDAKVTIVGRSIEEICGEKEPEAAVSEPSSGGIDSCVVGNWISETFTEGIDFLPLTGGAGVLVLIDAEGNFAVDFSGMEGMRGAESDLAQFVRVVGEVHGMLHTAGGEIVVDVREGEVKSVLTQDQDGGSLLNDVSGTFEMPFGPDVYFLLGSTPYQCSGNQLTLTTVTPLGTTTVPLHRE